MLPADRLSVPLWQQVAALLRNRIYNGMYPSGGQFPGELQLAEEFGVSRITVRRALEELSGEGLLVRRRGKPTVVSSRVKPRPAAATGFVEDLISLFQATQLTGYRVEAVEAPGWVQRFLGRQVVTRVHRTRQRDGLPFSVSDSYLPVELGQRLDPADLRRLQVLELLDHKLGAPVEEAEQEIEAIGAPAEVAPELELQPGAPVLRIDLRYRTSGGEPVACSRVHVRGDRYTYRARLFRRSGARGTERDGRPSAGES